MSSLSREPGHGDKKRVADTTVALINHAGGCKHARGPLHVGFMNGVPRSLSPIVNGIIQAAILINSTTLTLLRKK